MPNRSAQTEAQSTSTSREILTAADLAAMLRVNRETIYQETRAGRIPHVRMGTHYRYRRSAIEQWIAGEEHKPAA